MIKSIYDLDENVFAELSDALEAMDVKVRKVPAYLLNNAEYRNPPSEIWAPGEDLKRFPNEDAAYVYAINKYLMGG